MRQSFSKPYMEFYYPAQLSVLLWLLLAVPTAHQLLMHSVFQMFLTAKPFSTISSPGYSPWVLRSTILYPVAPGTPVQASRTLFPKVSIILKSEMLPTGGATAARHIAVQSEIRHSVYGRETL